MQRVAILKRLSHLHTINYRAYHDSVQKRFLATVQEVFPHKTDFPSRHIGPRKTEVVAMLDLLGLKVNNLIKFKKKKIFYSNVFIVEYFQSLDELTDKAVPKHIQLRRDLKLDEPFSKY